MATNATVVFKAKNKFVTFNNVPVTVEADGRVHFVTPNGRIVPGTDSTVTITLSGKTIQSSGTVKFTPGAEVALSPSGAVLS